MKKWNIIKYQWYPEDDEVILWNLYWNEPENLEVNKFLDPFDLPKLT
jgi:hypothetical protein